MAILEALPPLFLALVGAALAIGWGSVPERFAVRWDPTGAPERWSDRSAAPAVAILLAGALLVLALLALRRRLPARSPDLARGGPVARGALLGAAYALAAASGTVSALPLLAAPGPWAVVVWAGLGLLLAPVAAVAVAPGRDRPARGAPRRRLRAR